MDLSHEEMNEITTKILTDLVERSLTRQTLMTLIDLLAAKAIILAASDDVLFSLVSSEMHKAHVDMYIESRMNRVEPENKDEA